jgi:environmental stress-induced protein Ves
MSGLTVLRADDHLRMPWANGGGTTYQVATSPDGAGLDEFDWRVSLADVDSGGQFSTFAGVERILMVVEGSGMELVVDGRFVPLGTFDWVRFDGEAATSATLANGPTRDLNVMTRRGRCTATLDVVPVTSTVEVAPVEDGDVLVIVVEGDVRADDVPLWPRDAVVVDRATTLRGTATVAVIRVLHVGTAEERRTSWRSSARRS